MSLHSLRPYITRRIPLALLFSVTVITLVNFFFTNVPLISGTTGLATTSRNWAVILVAFALAIGVVQMTQVRTRRALNPKEPLRRRLTSILFLAEMWIIVILGLYGGSAGDLFKWVSVNIYTTLGQAQYGFVGFYITLACYRTLKLRRWDVTLFAVVVFVELFGVTPLFARVFGMWPSDFNDWIIAWPSLAGAKALTMLGTLGMIAVGIRGILGLERGVLGGGGGE